MCFVCDARVLVEEGFLPVDRALVLAISLGVRRGAVESCTEHLAMGNEVAGDLIQTSSAIARRELVPR